MVHGCHSWAALSSENHKHHQNQRSISNLKKSLTGSRTADCHSPLQAGIIRAMNDNRGRRAVLLFGAALSLLIGAACASETPPQPEPSPTPGVTLTPYVPRPEVAPTETPTPVRTPTPPPTPTATPFLYQIVQSDTLLGIAFKFGITLEELLAANPGIDPQFLTIGDALVIPLADNPAAAAALPTPVGEVVPAGAPVCWPTADGGLWCFALYENLGGVVVENLAAQVNVYGEDGDLLASRTAISPLNLLPPGSALPVTAWFPDLGPFYGQAGAVLQSALPLAPGDARYVPVEMESAMDMRGSSAVIEGEIAPAVPGAVFRLARIAAVAYDEQGRVAGVRVVEIPGDGDPVSAFQLTVYSEGGAIVRVDVFAEAYP